MDRREQAERAARLEEEGPPRDDPGSPPRAAAPRRPGRAPRLTPLPSALNLRRDAAAGATRAGARAGPAEAEPLRGDPEAPKALILAPACPELEEALAVLGGGWEVDTSARPADVEAIDPRTRLVLLDDRLPGSIVDLARAALARAASARVVLAVGPESIGEIVSAGLDGARVAWLFRPVTAEAIAAEVRELAAHDRQRGRPESERRAFPRAALEEPRVVAPAGVDLRDLGPGGALLVAPPGWTVGTRFPLELRVTSGAPVQRVTGEITRAEPAPLGRQAVAVRFVEPSARFQGLVRATILEHMTHSELRKLFRRIREEPSGCAPIVEPARVEVLLREFHEQQRPCIVSVEEGRHPWRSTLRRVDAAAGRIGVGRPGGGRRVVPGDGMEVFVNCSAESYLFEVQVLDVGGTEISCTWPDVVHYSEKRTTKRRAVPADAGAFVEIDAPSPWGTRSWPVRDLSSGGLSFVTRASEGVLLPGTPLRSLRIRVGDRAIAEHRGEIRHVAPLGDGTVLVGVGFVEGARAQIAAPAAPSPSVEGGARGRTPLPLAPDPKNRAPIFTPLPRSLDARTRSFVATPPVTNAPEAASPPAPRWAPLPGRRVRFFNSRKELVSGILDTPVVGDVRFAAPVVVIAPSFGRSKECFSTLARWLCDRFGRLGEPVAVLRFDFTHSKGESYIPERNRDAGRECLDFTMSSALDDLRAAIRFVHHTPLFEATRVVVVGYSMSAPLALRAAATDARVSHVVSVMGVPSVQDAVRVITGGLDYLAGHLKGERHGVVNLLGHLVDMDALCRDAVANGLATAQDTRRDIAMLPTCAQVSWLVGQHDGWVEERHIEHLLETKRRCARPDLIVLPTGHVPTVSDEAAAVAEETTRLVWRTVHGGEIPPGAGPNPETLERIAREEWARAPRAAMTERRTYWADYLLGTNGELGFDVLEWVGAYRDLMTAQVEMLDARPGHVVLDAGGGTGNFLAALLEAGAPLPVRVEIADLVPEALERARQKTGAAAERAGLAVDFRVKTVEVSRLRPVERFVRGEVHGPEWLRGRIDGLDDATLDRVLELYGPAMHAALRGGDLDRSLVRVLSDHERLVVEELGRAARLVLGRLRKDDLRAGCAADGSPIRTSHLRFERLRLGDAAVDEPLLFDDDGYDRVIASLLLPYVANPDETVREFHRALKPGGRLVISSNRPNSDLSEIFTKLVEDVSCGRVPPPPGMDRVRFLDELRAYTNSAAFLLRLTEEQTFRFFEPEQLREMLERAGFGGIEVRPSFGDPPQAFVAVGLKA